MESNDTQANGSASSTAVEELLERIRQLTPEARNRLATMLDEESDLPYLDLLERQYASTFRRLIPDQATYLRGRFVTALNEQRNYLLTQVRKVLHE